MKSMLKKNPIMMKTDKIIGIPGWAVGDNSFGVTKAYLEFASIFGDVKILTPNEDFDKTIDLIILPGGKDIDTQRYNERPGYFNSTIDPYLEYFDTVNLPKYIKKRTPIFGICRGLQSIAVIFGNKLIQNLVNHEYSETNRYDLAHEITIYPDGKDSIVKQELKTIKVNSLHHQAVDHGNKPNLIGNLMILAEHPKTQDVEAIKHRYLSISAVQWHPEEIYDEFSFSLISDLLNINVESNGLDTAVANKV